MFLITDPVDSDLVDYYLVELDGTVNTVDAEVADTEARLHWELPSLSLGSHSVRVNAVNEWGESGYSDPFDFNVVLPSVPSGIGLSEV